MDHLDLPALELDFLSKRDVRAAFRQAHTMIGQEQEKLRRIDPVNPLLGLVQLTSPTSLDFASNYHARMMEHVDESVMPADANIYYGLGKYIELLREEQTDPKFLSA